MGQVHRARAFGAGGVSKDLCIKRLRASLIAKRGAVERFVTEARHSMRLVHANIVPVFDFGRVGDDYFLAMEWVDGVDLARLLEHEEGPLPAELAAHVCAEVARALDYAHTLDREPIVHRDVKPANILISRAGDVRLTNSASPPRERRRGVPERPRTWRRSRSHNRRWTGGPICTRSVARSPSS